MAQIMEFLLNLLLLRKKFFTTTASETFHETIRKCLQFKRKISAEYKAATQLIGPFENMLEFINYNASQYRCEGENYVVTSEIYYHLKESENQENSYTPFRKDSSPTQTSSSTKTEAVDESSPKDRNPDSLSPCLNHKQKNNERKVPNQDHIIDNLNAILRSQEFLFKNIIKLVTILEKEEVLNTQNIKLKKLKKKLSSCSDVLANNSNTRKFSIINNLIEEEITRCRFRHGEGKTSSEISLKTPKPKGIEAALDSSRQENNVKQLKTDKSKIEIKGKEPNENKEVIVEKIYPKSTATPDVDKFLKKSKSDPEIDVSARVGNPRSPENILKEIHMDLADSKKVLEVNEQQFHKFEDTLWHSLTTMKFLSLKDEHLNMCKCAFYNKRHFVTTEATIMKKVKQEKEIDQLGKVLNVSNSVFQTMERKLLFEQVKQELQNCGQLPLLDELTLVKEVKDIPVNLENNPFKKLKEEYSGDDLKKQKLKSPSTNIKQEIKEEIEKKSEESQTTAAKEVEVIKQSDRKIIQQIFAKDRQEQNVNVNITKCSSEMVSVATETDDEKRKLRNSQETNTIISGFKLMKQMHDNVEKNENVDSKKGKKDSVVEEIQKHVVSVENVPIRQETIVHNEQTTNEDFLHCKRKGNICIKGNLPEQKIGVINVGVLKITTTSSVPSDIKPNVSESFMRKEETAVTEENNSLETNQKRKLEISQPSHNLKKLKMTKMPKLIKTKKKKNATSTATASTYVVPELKEEKQTKDKKLTANPPSNVKNIIVEEKKSEKSAENTNLCAKIKNQHLTKKHSKNILLAQKQLESYKKKKNSWPPITKKEINDSTKKSTTFTAKVVEKHMKNVKSAKRIDTPKVYFNIPSHKVSFPSKTEDKSTSKIPAEKKSGLIEDNTNIKSPTKKKNKVSKKLEGKEEILQDSKLEATKPISHISKNRTIMSESELKKEADLIEANQKAFAELEASIKNVKFFIKKTPQKKATIQSATEISKRKIDDSTKRNMSTVRMSKQKGDENDKKSTKYSLPSEKSKTFLKKKINKDLLLHSVGIKKSKHSLSQVEINVIKEDKNKTNSQMRRTTKNAMKRLQVSTIYPKVTKIDEKKKPVISLVETEEIKAAKINESRTPTGKKGSKSAVPKSESNFSKINSQSILRNS